MTRARSDRNCPKCRVPTARAHCKVVGCGWWICPECKLMFNQHGITAAYPKT